MPRKAAQSWNVFCTRLLECFLHSLWSTYRYVHISLSLWVGLRTQKLCSFLEWFSTKAAASASVKKTPAASIVHPRRCSAQAATLCTRSWGSSRSASLSDCDASNVFYRKALVSHTNENNSWVTSGAPAAGAQRKPSWMEPCRAASISEPAQLQVYNILHTQQQKLLLVAQIQNFVAETFGRGLRKIQAHCFYSKFCQASDARMLQLYSCKRPP